MMDFEKAYDYASRTQLFKDLLYENAGKTFINAVMKMYEQTFYYPLITSNVLGEKMVAKEGVTQGRRSSQELFTFLIKDMPYCINPEHFNDFMKPFFISQLADDSISLSEHRESLIEIVKSLFSFSDEKYQVKNINKTMFLHMAKSPNLQPIQIDDVNFISAADTNKGCTYLGLFLEHTRSVTNIMRTNLKMKMFNVIKYYNWLEINTTTPISIKLQVLDACMFAALLYSAETWGDIKSIESQIVKIERKVLKSILGVKQGTPNDLIYIELKRCNIISKIKKRQYNFYQRVCNSDTNRTMVKQLLDVCIEKNMSICNYYQNLNHDVCEKYINKLYEDTEKASNTLSIRYKNIIGFHYNDVLYNSNVNDIYRTLITRWRLSSIPIRIEIDRYKRPPIPRLERICRRCNTLEDEHHVLLQCPIYHEIRRNYTNLLSSKTCVKDLLNPGTITEIIETGKFLKEIESKYDITFGNTH